MAEKFKVYPSKSLCQKCEEPVSSIRLWLETADVTWMCSKKHISKVSIIRTKKDYEREK